MFENLKQRMRDAMRLKADAAPSTEQQSSNRSVVVQQQGRFGDHPVRGLTPLKLHEILDIAERGDPRSQWDLFQGMLERDAHLKSEYEKRKNALLNVDWEIRPPRDASAAEKRLARRLHDRVLGIQNFEDLLLGCMEGVGFGWAGLENQWDFSEGQWQLKETVLRPHQWFMPSDDLSTLLLLDSAGQKSPLWNFGWIVHRHSATHGYLTKDNLLRTAAWPYLFKNYALRDLSELLEIYGLPLRIGKYANGATDQQKSSLFSAILSLGHHAAGIFPQGMDLEIVEAAKGSHEPFMALSDWAERSMSKLMLGATLTSQADGKSTHALGKVHNEVRYDLRQKDARQVQSTLKQQLLLPLALLNEPSLDVRRLPTFHFDTVEPEDRDSFVKSMEGLTKIGVPISVSYVQAKLKLPVPSEGEPLLSMSANPPAPAAPVAAGQARLSAIKPPADLLAANTEGLDAALSPQFEGWMDQLMVLLSKAESLADFQDQLLMQFDNLDDSKMVEQMALALAVAEVSGRFGVKGG
jgi:phage gp29-like protein